MVLRQRTRQDYAEVPTCQFGLGGHRQHTHVAVSLLAWRTSAASFNRLTTDVTDSERTRSNCRIFRRCTSRILGAVGKLGAFVDEMIDRTEIGAVPRETNCLVHVTAVRLALGSGRDSMRHLNRSQNDVDQVNALLHSANESTSRIERPRQLI